MGGVPAFTPRHPKLDSPQGRAGQCRNAGADGAQQLSRPAQTDGDSLLSSKHSGCGTGTNSVRHIAAAHGGTAQFTLPQADTFDASVLLRIHSP